MKPQNYYLRNLVLILIIISLVLHLLATIYRFSAAPEWWTLIESVIFFLLLLCFLFWIINNSKILEGYNFCKFLIFFTYILRAIIAIINEHYQILPNLGDVAYYHQLGNDFSRELTIQGSGIGASAFGNYIIGNIYFIFGNSPVIISLINSFVYSIIILVIIMICNKVKFYDYWIVAMAASILPSSILYVPVLLRESFFLLFTVLFFYKLICLYAEDKIFLKDHFFALIYLIITTLSRPQVFPILVLIYISVLIYYQQGMRRLISIVSFIFLLIMVPLLNFTLFQFIDSNLFNLYYFQLYRNAFSDLPNAYLVNIVYRDWWDFLSYMPSFIIHFLFAPYPWVASSYKYFMATIDSILTMVIIIVSIIALIKNYQDWKKHIFPIIICFFIFLIPFAMIEAYPMGAVRHRMILTLMMLPIFSSFFNNKNNLSRDDKY